MLALTLQAHAAKPADAPQEQAAPATFESLRSNAVYLRTGPGREYPIAWVYTRRDLPVEVLAKSDEWCKIREMDGTTGWVHQTNLASRRGVIVTGGERTLRDRPADGATAEALLEPGVIARIKRCQGEWCKVAAGGYEGWLKQGEFWGTSPGEVID